jgi:hypothetical protein
MDFRSRFDGRVISKLSASGSVLDRLRDMPGLIVFLLALAFMVHGTAVQSHVHFAEQATATAAPNAVQIEASPSKDGDSSAFCPLCQEAAMARAYLLPSAPIVPPPPATDHWAFIAAIAAFAILAPPLGWSSRAPPE